MKGGVRLYYCWLGRDQPTLIPIDVIIIWVAIVLQASLDRTLDCIRQAGDVG